LRSRVWLSVPSLATMRRMTAYRNLLSAIFIALLSACTSVPPPPQQGVGSLLPETTIEDQHGNVHSIDDSVRLVLMSRDMDGGRIVREALEQTGPEALEQAAAVYISDISGMPGLIQRSMAIPAMRKRPYPMLLDRTGDFTAAFPAEPGKATLLVVDRRRVSEIRFAGEVVEVVTVLEGGGAR